MENKIFNTKYTKVDYKVNHINEIPNPDKEIYRKKVIDNINDKYKKNRRYIFGWVYK